MDIKDRIVRIIGSEGLTSSAFADHIGVQRSNISHILSGRNKPSLDFLEKILRTFNKYNAEWLILGTGDIYKIPKQSSIFDHPEVISGNESKAQDEKEEDKTEPLNKKRSISSSSHVPTHAEKHPTIQQSQDSEAKHPNDKYIKRIVIFYNDGSFEEYRNS